MNFIILPYATISRPLTVSGITFRSSDDLDGLDKDAVAHINTLCKLFYLNETLRLNRMIYHYSTEDTRPSYPLFRRKVWHASICLKYICTHPNPPSPLPSTYSGPTDHPEIEIAEMFLFSPIYLTASHYFPQHPQENVVYTGSEPEDSYQRMLPGYGGVKLGRGVGFSIGPTGRIYTPSLALDSHLSFRYGIDLAAIYDALSHGSKWAIKAFMASDSEELTDLEKRVFKALDWYNQSCEYGIHPYKSLVFLAIAFEALLNLEWEQKNTARFKDVVMSLLGSVDRLDTWLNQFFDARGSIVHTGEAARLVYSPPQAGRKSEPQKRTQGGKTQEPKADMPTGLLTHQGRIIFHLCLDAILSSSVTAHEANLRASFIHDEERIKEIAALLDDDTTELRRRILTTRNLVFELCGSIYRPASKVKPVSLMALTGKMMSIYLESKLHETLGIPTEITTKMAALVKSAKEVKATKAKIEPCIALLSDVNSVLRTWHANSLELGGLPRDDSLSILIILINYSVEYLRYFACF